MGVFQDALPHCTTIIPTSSFFAITSTKTQSSLLVNHGNISMVLALPPDRTLLPAGHSSVAGLESNILLVIPLNLL